MIEAKAGTRVTLLKAPTDEDWKEVNRRARTTVGYTEGVDRKSTRLNSSHP